MLDQLLQYVHNITEYVSHILKTTIKHSNIETFEQTYPHLMEQFNQYLLQTNNETICQEVYSMFTAET
ncbi:MAG: hypothetical protein AB8U25_05705 [Rickettsiales endosymbiont of Dermacentor nuttalli]